MIKLIAEIGINANGSMDNVKKLMQYAKLAGFDYVKFQKRTPDLCVPEDQKNKPKSTPWGEMTYLEYKKKIELSLDDYDDIDVYASKLGIGWFASVWDIESAKEMSEFTDIVKVPSALITDIPLLKECRELFKKVIISTGMSDQTQIDTAIQEGKPDVVMHTNSTYPSPIDEINLSYILYLRDKYKNIEIGYSGHEFGLTVSFAAAAMQVDWIERHITLDRTMWGSDQSASVEPTGMIKLVKGIRDIEKAFGKYGQREITASERVKLQTLRK